VTAPGCGWRLEDWLNKRLFAWLNLRVLGRGYRFRSTAKVLKSLREELRHRPVDHLIFSGDATAMGFEEEVMRAADLLEVGRTGAAAGMAVPGNHDYCTVSAARAGYFEHYFAPWLEGERVDDYIYPFAQRVGHAWLIAVNSATANRWPWDARGRVGAEQLQRLEQLLQRLGEGPRILVTHYPVWRRGGKPERVVRALRDLEPLVDVARRGRIGLWLHGHRHETYYHRAGPDLPFPVICAGSTTQQRRWTYLEYTLTGYRLRAQQRTYDPDKHGFYDSGSFELDLVQ